jgi:tetratricopeptide (TPR) repeat protein
VTKPASPTKELLPDIKVELSSKGIEKGKDQGNSLFSKGSTDEAVKWFSKCIWLIEMKKVSDVPSDLHSILHSNRAFAYVKLKKWAEAEEDCSAALAVKSDNTKAKYRRAMARFELGKYETAKKDVDDVLTLLPDPKSKAEAGELKQRIEEKLKPASPKADTKAALSSPASAKAAPEPSKPAEGFKRMQIVEASDDESDEAESQPTAKPVSPKDLLPEIKIELTSKGIEDGKNQGNSLFAKGSTDEAVKWFSKCIWLIEMKKVSDIPADLHSILHSNRAFAYIKLRKWMEAEEDCSAALAVKTDNAKAKYRRAMARFELGKYETAKKDVDDVLTLLPDPKSKAEAAELRQRIGEKLKPASPTAAPAKATPEPNKPAEGFKRMQIVEASDDESDDAVSSEVPKPKSPSSELLPEIQVASSRDGVEQGKNQGNSAFAKGSTDEAIKWFTKCIWLIDTNKVKDVPADLHSVLHSNRAHAYNKLSKWTEAEEDCTKSLAVRSENTKGRYRRAVARFELGKHELALADVEQVLREIPEGSPQSNHSRAEAAELQKRIKEKNVQSTKATPTDSAPKTDKEPASGWQRLQVVEASDDESDEELHPEIEVECSGKGIEAAKQRANELYSSGKVQDAVKLISKCIWLIDQKRTTDVSTELQSILHSNRALANVQLKDWQSVEKDCDKALALNCKNTKAKYRRAVAYFELGRIQDSSREVDVVLKEVVDAKANKEAVELKRRITQYLESAKSEVRVAPEPVKSQQEPPQLSTGFKKMQIVEAEESDDDVSQEEYPDIKIEPTEQGLTHAKDHANRLFADGSLKECVRWFSKCIYVIDSKRIADVSAELHSVLHSNRAFTYIKMKDWTNAERDCTRALSINKANMKAQYRRALANFELGHADTALTDVDVVIKNLADPSMNPEATDLKRRIVAKLNQESHEQSAPSRAPQQAAREETAKSERIKEPSPPPSPQSPAKPDIYPELQMECTKAGVEKAREQANALFSKGSLEEAARWFSKCLWLIGSGQVSDDESWSHTQRTALHSNRALAYIKLCRWEEAESDCSSSLSLCPTGVKALYRRAQARIELGKLEDALEDIKNALKQQPDNSDLLALQDRTRKRLGASVKSAAVPTKLEEVSSSPSSSPTPSPTSRGLGPSARAAAAVRAAPAPSVPKQSPKNSVEMLRNFHSMQKHPAVLARYVRERVPPSLVEKIFARAPIEPDDLATLLAAIRANLKDEEEGFKQDVVADYLKSLLKTYSADIQFGMLSDSEKEVVRELLATSSADSLQAKFRKILS